MSILKRRLFCLMLVVSMVLAIPAYAREDRAISAISDIQFNDTKADCMTRIAGQRTSDKISATMSLWNGSKLVDEWSASGYFVIEVHGTATVAKNRTYKLTVEYTINGEEKTPFSITRTNR